MVSALSVVVRGSMVRISKVYTKTGDDGTTGLVGGVRVSKADPRVEAYGTVDEANACIGLAVVAAEGAGASDIADLLRSVQHDLFDAGADLATPVVPGEGRSLRITPAQTERLERAIDAHNPGLPGLTSFVLPGGSASAAALHLARTVVRRAERCAVALLSREPKSTSAEVVRYLNRLSDLLFVLGRVANARAGGDVLWVPGANRGESGGAG
ncbi:MAG: cob(I)yrinic acid a,c-diamide adenosyltransferase [Phycisphaerales bacterium]|nr:cob(I)yrinic acid a,c-diamide adenosyltransferase [Phycisphaerales bacterium]